MTDLESFLQTMNLNTKALLPKLKGQLTVPKGQRIFPGTEASER